jgi:chromosome partitioning protein
MSVVAVYNLKGGVGKTTAAVNLSYLSASGGARTLLWDLDPQGASSFAFRIQPRVDGFGRKALERGTLVAAIKASDFERLEILPADFAYRKLDRLLGAAGKSRRLVADLLDPLARDYDTIILDCPPGFSLLTEAVFGAADLVVVPTIPTVLSLRTLARLLTWAHRSDRPPALTAFLSMVDRRKTLHRRACQWAALQRNLFLASQVPYASIVEQMTVRRMPLPAFAPGDPAALAFAAIWHEIQHRHWGRDEFHFLHTSDAIDALIAELESVTAIVSVDRDRVAGSFGRGSQAQTDLRFVHSFDTDRGDLQRSGYVVELHERSGSFLIVAAESGSSGGGVSQSSSLEVPVDGKWATQILSGGLSPLTALERRLGQRTPQLVATMRAATRERPLRRLSSVAENPSPAEIVDAPTAALA